MNTQQRAFVAASVAGLVMAMSSAVKAHANEMPVGDEASGKVPCYGINKCKGTGDCGGKANSCAGTNACSGQAFISLDKDDCLRIQGGRLTVDAETQKPS